MIDEAKKYYREVIAISFTVIGLYCRYKELASRTLWVDEINQINNTLGPFQPIWKRLPLGELTCFPGEYLITYPFVQVFETNKWGVSIPHMVGTVIGFFLLYVLCRRYFRSVWSWLLTFAMFAFNRELIFHAFEIRPYAILPTLSLGVFLVSEDIVRQGRALRMAQKVLITVFFIFTVVFHAYGLPIIVFCTGYFLVLELVRRPFKEIIKDIWPFMGLVALIIVPIFLWYASGTTINRQLAKELDIKVFEFIPNPVTEPVGFLKAIFGNLVGHKIFYIFLIGLFLSAVLPQRDRWPQIIFFILVVVVPIQIIMISDFRQGYWLLQRQFIWITPLFLFYLGWCWDSIIWFSYRT